MAWTMFVWTPVQYKIFVYATDVQTSVEFFPEDTGIRFLRNSGKHLHDCSVSHPSQPWVANRFAEIRTVPRSSHSWCWQVASPSSSVRLVPLTRCGLFVTDLIYALLQYFPAFLGVRQPLLRLPYPHETPCPIRQSITGPPDINKGGRSKAWLNMW